MANATAAKKKNGKHDVVPSRRKKQAPHEVDIINSPPEGTPAAFWVSVDKLVPWVKNPRKNDRAVEKAINSIREFGWGAPLIARQENGEIIGGHSRIKAAHRLGIKRVPVRYMTLDERKSHALALADNKVGEFASWDEELLPEVMLEFKEDRALFDATGFKFDDYFSNTGGGSNDDEAPPLPTKPVTKLGNIWVLGRHRLVCGDSTKVETFKELMRDESANLLWTDPPYNVAYEGKTKKALTIENDSMSDDKFRAFLRDAFTGCDGAMLEGACFYIAHADTEGYNFRGAVRDVGWKLAQCLIWAKDSMVLSRQDYHWQHEPMLYGWKLGAGHHMLVDRTQTTLWEHARPKKSEEHPTMKPPDLIERAIKNSTNDGALVLDPFAGSGSTVIAAERCGRRANLIELDPRYCDVIVERWQTLTGQKAKRAS